MSKPISVTIFANSFSSKGSKFVAGLYSNSKRENMQFKLITDQNSIWDEGELKVFNEVQTDASACAPCDFIVSIGWDSIIPPSVVGRARIAAINVHSSLLPDYKGVNVYKHQWANLAKVGGVSVHLLSEKFDEGNIICSNSFEIPFFCRPRYIRQKNAEITPDLVFEAIQRLLNGETGTLQQGGRYFYKIGVLRMVLYRLLNTLLALTGVRIITRNRKISV
jgi:folate-dependent phosphoribosylglycinamide formyltransferase PurN